MEYIVWKLEGSTLTKVTNNSPVKGTNNAYAECLYGAWGTDAVKVNFLPQRFYDLNGVNPVAGMKATQITDQEKINAIVPESEQEANYGLWYFPMLKGITSILTSHNQSKYKISFERLALEDDDEYIGEYATASTVSATINSELLSEFASAVENQYVNVYLTTTNVYASYLFDGTEWVAQSSVLNESIIDRTQSAEELFKGTVFGNEDYTTKYDPSELANVLNGIYAEFADLNNTISAVNDALANYMLTEEYDSESGIASKAVKYATNLKGDSTFITSQSVIEHIINVSNPHSVTKAQLGLGNVDNTSDADKPISNAQAAVNAVKADLVGGLVPADQLPSYVDDVIEVATYADLPATGESGKIYVVVADETSGGNTSTYRWATSVYVMISNELSASEVKALYESNANTNAYTDTEKSIVAVAQENVIETVKVNGVTESVTSKAVDIDVPVRTSELINDGDGTTNFVTAEQLGDAGYGDMTKAEFNTNGTAGVVDKAVVAEELETSAVNDLPYIGDSSWDLPKNGIPTAIGKDNLVIPSVEGLTYAQIVDGENIADLGTVTFAGISGTRYIDTLHNTILTGAGVDITITNDTGDVADINIIPVPTKIASYTNAQILKFFSGVDYIPKGLHGIEDLKIVSNYTNLFDYVEYNANNAYEYLIEVVSGLSYKFSESIGYKLYDKDEIEISSGTSSTVTATDAKYISFNSGIADVEAFMLTLSSYTGDYVPYQAPLTYELDTPMYSNDTRDLQGDAVDTTVVKNLTSWSIAGTKTNTHFFFKMLPISIEIKTPDNDGEKTVNSLIIGETVFTNETRNGLNDDVQNTFAVSSNGSINIRVNKTTYPTSADFEAYLQANDVTFIYELATPLPRTEANDNLLVERGALLVSEYGTYTQGDQYGVKTEFNAKSALDLVKQVQIGVSTDVAQEKKLIEIDNRICGTHAAIQVLELTAARINRITYKPDYDYASQSYLFPQNNTTERMYATLPSPNDWVVGTPIRIQVHITQEDTGQAVMKVDYKLFEAAGATIPATATTYTMDTYVDDSYVSGSMSNALRDGVEIDTSDITTRAFIRLEIYRDDNVYSGDLKVDDVAIFYTAYNCCDCSTVE